MTATSSTMWQAGFSNSTAEKAYPGKATTLHGLDQGQKRMAQEKQASKRRKTLERELEWVRMAPQSTSGQRQAV